MTDKFLKAKHWQLFILTFGIPMFFQIVIIGLMMSSLVTNKEPNPVMMFNYMQFFPLILIIFMTVMFGWFWSVAIGLQKLIPDGVTIKVKKFKIFYFIPLVYILIFLTFFGLSINSLSSGNPALNVGMGGIIVAVIFPLHLFSMFCIFHSLYFVAKTFKTVELQREVTFSDFVGEFFMIWFYPIGIWFIQPKINKIINDHGALN